MRIAYMLTSLGIGGAERQVVALAERMASRGHTVVLIVLQPRALKSGPPNFRSFIWTCTRRSPASSGSLKRGRRFLREFHPDLVHSHTYPANMFARVLKLLGAAPAVLSTIHNVYEGGWPRMLTYRLTDGLSLRTTAVSEAAADRYMRKKAVPQRKCTVITNAIDTAEFAPRAIHRATSRAEQGVTDEFVWLAAGRIVPAKDYANLLRAFTQCAPYLTTTHSCGLPRKEQGRSSNASTPSRRNSASTRPSAGSAFAAICLHCSTPRTGSSSLPPGKECRSPLARPWPWRNPSLPRMWAGCAKLSVKPVCSFPQKTRNASLKL